jgi:hypothetical protein
VIFNPEKSRDMKKENWFSLVLVIIGLAFQGVAWIWDSVSQDLRVVLTILSLLPGLVALIFQGVQSQGMRAWFPTLIVFLRANIPLIIVVLLSLGALTVLPLIVAASYLEDVAMSISVVLFSVSIFSLIRGLGGQPSLRVVKGSTDAVYLVKDGVKRLIPNPLTMFFILLDTYREIECISDTQLALYREGQPIPDISSLRLVQGTGPAIYVVWEGQRKHIPDPPTYNYFFNGRKPEKLNDVDLEAIPRTGALRSILSISPTITIQGDVGEISLRLGRPQ